MQKKRTGVGVALAALAVVGILVGPSAALASPAITSAVINSRVFNDDPGSIFTPADAYPVSVSVTDVPSGAPGGANLHNFRLSTNNFNSAQFQNLDAFSMETDLTITGAGQGEAGLQVAPWWSPNVDGRFNFRTTDGEIACFGGRLPFFSFTGTYGLTYVKGDTVRAGVIYNPHSTSSSSPATIEYTLTLGGNDYTSGPLPFDEGNPAEAAVHGAWGALSPFEVGGHMQIFLGPSGAGNALTATWGDIEYTPTPEPASLALLGLGALTLVRRRR